MLQPKRKENELGCSINLVPRAFPLKNGWGGPHPFFKGKALGTRLLQYFKVQMNFFNVFQSPSVLRNPDFGIWKIFLVESWNPEILALECGIQLKESMQNPTNDWNLVTRIRNP